MSEVGEALRQAAEHVASSLRDVAVVAGKLDQALLDGHQVRAFHLAFLAAEARAAQVVDEYGSTGELERALADVALGELARSGLDRQGLLRAEGDWTVLHQAVARGFDPDLRGAVAEAAASDSGPRHLEADLKLAADAFGRFGDEVIAPLAEEIHRRDLDIPEEIITGLAGLGAFGLSVPRRYGGAEATPSAMVVATEELSRASLGAGGSLITRPEMLTRALMAGGTDQQRDRWLPAIADGSAMVAVGVTEPGHGSDVAGIRTMARRHEGGFVIGGAKAWCTFAGRADLLMLLARTHPDPGLRHRGLSLFVVEKPARAGKTFRLEQHRGGRLEGAAIDTLGYRGMHSFELAFDGWRVPATALIGGEAGEGRGFYLQMAAFATGRLQTAARAVGLMEAAYREAASYARERRVFGRPLLEFGLSAHALAGMAARIQAARQLTYEVAREGNGDLEAALVKALSCRWALEVTDQALQLHGGWGYAEEYPVSRYQADARVLPIFEGAEEVLATRVIARRLVEQAG